MNSCTTRSATKSFSSNTSTNSITEQPGRSQKPGDSSRLRGKACPKIHHEDRKTHESFSTSCMIRGGFSGHELTRYSPAATQKSHHKDTKTRRFTQARTW